jgi:hypothetical protein
MPELRCQSKGVIERYRGHEWTLCNGWSVRAIANDVKKYLKMKGKVARVETVKHNGKTMGYKVWYR